VKASDEAQQQRRVTGVRREEIIIVGAGQAGLAIGYWLKRQQRSFLLLDAGPHIGESWRKRYDSLVLFTPRRYSALPGLAFPGDPEGRPTKDEMADYLQTYADHFALPIQADTRVVGLQKQGETFLLQTTQGPYQAGTVIVATGPFHHPRIPLFASALSSQVEQLHSASYHNPSQLPPGPVLVVGAGDSGAHIAAELACSHAVSLAAAHPLYFVPLTLLGKSLFWYLDRLRLLEVDGATRLGRWLKAQPEPVLGLELKRALRERQVQVRPRATSAQDDVVQFADGSQAQVRTVICATGYRQDFSWIRMPGVADECGHGIEHQGVSSTPGLFFLGFPWQPSRGSALVGWVGKDAKRLAALLQSTVHVTG
jgi:putative flavoprotein involved in K+ transport